MSARHRKQMIAVLAGIFLVQCLFSFLVYPHWKRKSGQSVPEDKVVCEAVFSRFLDLLTYPHMEKSPGRYTLDIDYYGEIARNLVAGNGYAMGEEPHLRPTIRRMPAYPVFLAFLISIAGDSSLIVTLVQLALVMISCYWCYRLAAKENHLAGLISILILGGYPLVLLYVPRFYSEILTLFAITGGLFSLNRFLTEKRAVYFYSAVLFFSLAWLSRASIMIWILPAGFFLLRETHFVGKKYLFLIGAILFLACASPWVIRNYTLTGRFIPGTTWNTRSALHGLKTTSHPWSEVAANELDQFYQRTISSQIKEKIGPITSPQKEALENDEAFSMYLKVVCHNPGKVILSWFRGLFRIYFHTSSFWMKRLEAVVNVALVILVLFGAVAGSAKGRNNVLLRYLWLLLVVVYLFHSLVYPLVRYLIPALPALAVLGGIGFSRAVRFWRGDRNVDEADRSL